MSLLRRPLFPLLLFIIYAVTAGSAFAAVTGKITGTVKNRNTGEPIAGANVTIEGTKLGAATDLDGDFIIINI